MTTPIDVVVLKYCKSFPTGNRSNRALFIGQKKQNKISAPSQTVASAQIMAPIVCQGQPTTFGSQCSKCHVQISSLSAEL